MKKELRKSQGVYAVHVVENDVNYVYIGSGLLGDRVSGNPSKLRRNKHDNKQLQEVYNRVLDCKVEILQVCKTKEEARELENDYVEYYKRLEGVVVCNQYPAVTTKEYRVVLNKEKVIEIKHLLQEEKMKNKEIAELYGVTDSVISKIKTGLRWASVEM